MGVRLAEMGDARRIAEIHVRAWQIAYRGIVPDPILEALSADERQWFWEERFRRSTSSVLVSVGAAGVMGWLVFGASRDDDAADSVWEIYGLYVDPEHWRRGVARDLWRESRRRLEAKGVAEVTLWVLRDNVRGRAFYEAVGFVLDAGAEKQWAKDGATLTQVRYRVRLGEGGEIT